MTHLPSIRVWKGFTLVEFLVVVAILAVLAAILFPTFGRTHCDERRASCQSNLKQILLGMKQYTQDYEYRYPVVQHGADRTTGWAAMVLPYIKNSQIYQCPTERNKGTNDPASPNYCDYFFNSNLTYSTKGMLEADIKVPDLTILLGEATSFSSSNSSNGGTITSIQFGVDGTKGGLAMAQGRWNPTASGLRHWEGANYGFADGHVKWLKPEKVTREPVSSKQFTFRWSSQNPPSSGS